MAASPLDMRIEHLTLDLEPGPGGTAEQRALLETVLRKLGERLARTAAFGGRSLRPLVLERLSITTLSADELLGPRGAERLADELYAELTRRLG